MFGDVCAGAGALKQEDVMRWIIDGADRNSGEDRTVLVEAQTRADAERQAGRLGLLIDVVRADDPRQLSPLDELVSDPTGENPALARLAEEWNAPAPPPRDSANHGLVTSFLRFWDRRDRTSRPDSMRQ